MNPISTFRSAMVALVPMIIFASGGATLAQSPAAFGLAVRKPLRRTRGYGFSCRLRQPRAGRNGFARGLGQPGASGNARAGCFRDTGGLADAGREPVGRAFTARRHGSDRRSLR